MINIRAIAPASREVRTIASVVPYGTLIATWMRLNAVAMLQMVQRSRQYERAYLAWETVRKTHNPFFADGTGFEGYYVGHYGAAQQVAEQLLEIGHDILDNNARLYRYNYVFLAQLEKTLWGELEDYKSVAILAAQLGAILGRLRCNLLTNLEARLFQSATYQTTSSLPAICYQMSALRIQQYYSISGNPLERAISRGISFEQLGASDAEARSAIISIGKFGHPLLRAYLDQRQTVLDC